MRTKYALLIILISATAHAQTDGVSNTHPEAPFHRVRRGGEPAGIQSKVVGPCGMKYLPEGVTRDYFCRLTSVSAHTFDSRAFSLMLDFKVMEGEAKGKGIAISLSDERVTQKDQQLKTLASRFINLADTNLQVRLRFSGYVTMNSTLLRTDEPIYNSCEVMEWAAKEPPQQADRPPRSLPKGSR